MDAPGASTDKLHAGGDAARDGPSAPGRSRRKRLCTYRACFVVSADPSRRPTLTTPSGIILGLLLAVLVIAGATVGALIAKDIIKVGSKSASSSGSTAGNAPDNRPTTTAGPAAPTTTASRPTSTPSPVACSKPADIPQELRGTWQDPTSWLDMTGFNCSFTAEKVGDLPLVGLNSTWDDSAQANSEVPALDKPWGSYASRPFRGVSIGGWLSLEPFITPSLFADLSLVDEYTLCAKLGPKEAAATLEKHYATFVTEADFKAIAAAGLDHVRIPFSYWAIKTFDKDPYVVGVSWRYLLRGIEWARKYGLRVKLDLHGAPGSQNGWNHSGKQGKVNWLEGPDGPANAQRTLDLHVQLAKFFAQDRYKNVVAFYGLLNEPARALSQDDLIAWTEQAYKIVKDNGVTAVQVFSESMRGLPPWAGKLTGYGDSLVLDVHQYTIFDNGLIGIKHAERANFACKSYTDQVATSMDAARGFGPTMVGEWSQADTDCARYLNGVGNGARWDGTFNGNGADPHCPTGDSTCSCAMANADPSTFTAEYKLFLQTWAEAQMSAFEKGWGWFYWTWKTESAPLWSYQAGLQGKYLPALAYKRDWDCSKPMPSFGSLPEYY